MIGSLTVLASFRHSLMWRRFTFLILVMVPFIGISVVRYVEESLDPSLRPNYSRIEEGLFMGGHVPGPPARTKTVLNLCEVEDRYRTDVYRWEPIRDAAPAPSLDWLRDKVEFVETQRKAGNQTYVHCIAGASRSGMVVVAYLMAKNNWSRDEALAFVKSRRSQTRPNPAFMKLLEEWEQELRRKRG